MKLLKVSKQRNPSKGFTLLELVIVMVLLGVMAVGITSFVSLTTQTYVNVSARDELIASARFAIERMNREIRNAVPNSIRVTDSSSSIQCIEFVPIIASTTYTDIPVAPEPNLNEIKVIPFNGIDSNPYSCGPVCLDFVTVYPLVPQDVYNQSFIGTGKSFRINPFTATTGVNEWTVSLAPPLVGPGILFDDDSPTERAYVFRSPVSYCVNNGQLIRYQGHGFTSSILTMPTGQSSLMAENLTATSVRTPFIIQNASLQRNAIVQMSLGFERDGETIVFDQEIHIVNVP